MCCRLKPFLVPHTDFAATHIAITLHIMCVAFIFKPFFGSPQRFSGKASVITIYFLDDVDIAIHYFFCVINFSCCYKLTN